MIGYIKGIVEYMDPESILLEANNVGFRIFVPQSYQGVRLHLGDEVQIFTFMSVREDDITLFGFLTQEELEVYKLLLSVSGIGPKAALGVLSFLEPDALRLAVLTDDDRTIAKAPGIGKKTAQKIILELKDKFDLEDVIKPEAGSVTQEAADTEAVSDAVQALVSLGYSNSDSLKAVRKAASSGAGSDSESLLKAALKLLF